MIPITILDIPSPQISSRMHHATSAIEAPNPNGFEGMDRSCHCCLRCLDRMIAV